MAEVGGGAHSHPRGTDPSTGLIGREANTQGLTRSLEEGDKDLESMHDFMIKTVTVTLLTFSHLARTTLDESYG